MRPMISASQMSRKLTIRRRFASRWLAEIREEDRSEVRKGILHFAQDKLLCVPNAGLKESFNQDEKFAMLSTRLPLEFNAVTNQEKARENKYVEKHLRVCLDVAPGFESVATVSASEPLLAEAAEMLMQRFNPGDAPRVLLNEWESGGLSKGDRGEMVAALIFLLARDRAHPKIRRYISIPEFFSNLVRSPHAEKIMKSLPSKLRTGDKGDTFANTFGKSYLWFNHFIKVEDFAVVERKFLWKYIVRGCAIVCADNQYGTDIILPVVYRNTALGTTNTSAIFAQIRNRKNYSTPTSRPFDAMDPWDVGTLVSGDTPLPMIRIVFSMNSDNPSVEVMTRPEPRKNPPRAAKTAPAPREFTTYDIWLGGVSKETLCEVTDESQPIWTDTLKAARDHRRDVFVSGKLRKKAAILTKAQHPSAGSDPAHWSFVYKSGGLVGDEVG